MCFCIKIIVIIDLHHQLLHCHSWWFSLLLLESFIMCSLEHLCVVAVPTTGCFQYVCHLTYIFCSIGVLQLVAATMCVLSALPYVFVCYMYDSCWDGAASFIQVCFGAFRSPTFAGRAINSLSL